MHLSQISAGPYRAQVRRVSVRELNNLENLESRMPSARTDRITHVSDAFVHDLEIGETKPDEANDPTSTEVKKTKDPKSRRFWTILAIIGIILAILVSIVGIVLAITLPGKTFTTTTLITSSTTTTSTSTSSTSTSSRTTSSTSISSTVTTATTTSTSTTRTTTTTRTTISTSTSTTSTSTSTTTSETTTTSSTSSSTSTTSTTTTTTTSITTTVCTSTGRGNLGLLTGYASSSWTQYDYRFTASKNEHVLIFGFEAAINRSWLMDNVTVVEHSASLQLIQNGDFELSNSSIPAWEQWCSSYCHWGTSGRLATESDCYNTSGHCFISSCLGPGTDFLGQSFPTTPGLNYTVSFSLLVTGTIGYYRTMFYVDIF